MYLSPKSTNLDYALLGWDGTLTIIFLFGLLEFSQVPTVRAPEGNVKARATLDFILQLLLDSESA